MLRRSIDNLDKYRSIPMTEFTVEIFPIPKNLSLS